MSESLPLVSARSFIGRTFSAYGHRITITFTGSRVSKGRILIVGGDSKIGQALASTLPREGYSVITTTRRSPAAANTVVLDLMDGATWKPPEDVEVAVLAGAMTNLENCRQNPVLSAQVNLHGLLAVAQQIRRRGARLIYLSSSAVFDGRKLFPAPEDPVCPVSEYGRQKAAAEAGLRALDDNVTIVRLTKVLEPVVPIFCEWQQKLRLGQAIAPFHDLTMAPIPLECVITVLRLLIASRRGGCWHVSGDKDISYAQIARRAAQLAEVNEALVQPISALASGKVKENYPPRTALSSGRLLETFGIQPPPTEWSVDAALRRSWSTVVATIPRAA